MTTVHMAGALSALIQLAVFSLVVAWKPAPRRRVRVEAVPIDDPTAARSCESAGFGPGRRAVRTLSGRIRAGAEPALPE
jgi:hypothetical protein